MNIFGSLLIKLSSGLKALEMKRILLVFGFREGDYDLCEM